VYVTLHDEQCCLLQGEYKTIPVHSITSFWFLHSREYFCKVLTCTFLEISFIYVDMHI
jgi:hypothetical protein